MKLSHIEVSNHSRIRDLKVDVRGHAVIVGANDVGKSSLLRLLNMLLGTSMAQLYQQAGIADLANSDMDLVVEAKFVDFADSERTLFHREISIRQSDKSESMRVQLVIGADPDDDRAVVIRRWFPESGHDDGAH